MLKMLILICFIMLSGKLEFKWMASVLILGFMSIYFFMQIYNPMMGPSILSGGFMMDSLSMALMSLTCWVGALVLLSSQEILSVKKDSKVFLSLVLAIIFFLCFIFSVSNFFFFYLGFEAVLIPTLILIMGWGSQPERLNASFYFFLYTLLSSLPLLGFLVYQFFQSGSSFFLFFSFFIYINKGFWGGKGFVFLMTAFFVKLPMYGVHLWLPKAHVEAPVGGSMFLAAILLKMGVYGLFRFLEYNIWSVLWLNTFLMSLALVGASMISLLCFVQFDMKSLVAFSSVSHMALVLCGLLSGNSMGWNGSFLLSIAHGLASSGFFALVTFIYEVSYSRSILFNKGLILMFPFLGFFLFLYCMTNMAAPPTLNLLSEIILYLGVMTHTQIFLILLFLVSWMGVGYNMIFFTQLCFNKANSSANQGVYINLTQVLVLILHLSPCFLLILGCFSVSFW